MRDFPMIEMMYWILVSLWRVSPLWLIPAALATAFMVLLVSGQLLEENHANGGSAVGKAIAIAISVVAGCFTAGIVMTLTAMILHV